MSVLNFPNAQWIGVTTFSPGTTFFIAPTKGQIGIHFYSGSTGIEISGAGASYGAAATAVTLLYGVTTFMTFVNSNGSSLILAANGKGLPVYNTTLDGKTIVGGAPIWGTASGASLLLTVAIFSNDAFPNG